MKCYLNFYIILHVFFLLLFPDESGKKALDAILTGNEFKELVKDWQSSDSVVQTGQGQDAKVDELVIQEMTENR